MEFYRNNPRATHMHVIHVARAWAVESGPLHYSCSAACNISLYYYAGFCYLLLRRYTDAARTFNIVLNYISRCGCILFFIHRSP